MKIKKIKCCLFSLFTFSLLVSVIVIFQQSTAADDGYVGEDVCRACHQQRYDSYLKSTHSKAVIPGYPANRNSCESCHGPGLVHVQKGGGKGTGMIAFGKKDDPEAKQSRCLSCHQDSKAVPLWDLSKHKVNGVSCSDCHSGHSGTKNNLKIAEPALCFT